MSPPVSKDWRYSPSDAHDGVQDSLVAHQNRIALEAAAGSAFIVGSPAAGLPLAGDDTGGIDADE